MNSNTPVIDLAEVACAIVRVAYMNGLEPAGATIQVLAERKAGFENAKKILEMVQGIIDKNPLLAEEISKHRKHRTMNSAQTGFVARTAQALQDIENRAPVIEIWQQQEEPPLPTQILKNGQYVFWDIVPTVLRRAGR